MDMLHTCCFTGHRPETLYQGQDTESSVYEKIYAALEQAIEDGYRCFMCGAARGADLLFAEAVLRQKRMFPDVELVCVLPCRDQAANWPYEDREAYADILDAADSVVCLNEQYTRGCMHQRNRYMVDRSSLLIAAYNGSPGGTEYTVRYAKSRKLSIRYLLTMTSQDDSGQLSF